MSGSEERLQSAELPEHTEEAVDLALKDGPIKVDMPDDNVSVAQLVLDENMPDQAAVQVAAIALDEGNGESTELMDKENDLTWVSLIWLYLVAVSSGALRLAEYVGEKLADLFGITAPRYGYVMEEWDRIQRREKEEEKERAAEQERYQQELDLKSMSLEEGSAAVLDGDVAYSHQELTLPGEYRPGRLTPVSSSDERVGNEATPLTPPTGRTTTPGIPISPGHHSTTPASPMLEDVEL